MLLCACRGDDGSVACLLLALLCCCGWLSRCCRCLIAVVAVVVVDLVLVVVVSKTCPGVSERENDLHNGGQVGGKEMRTADTNLSHTPPLIIGNVLYCCGSLLLLASVSFLPSSSYPKLRIHRATYCC